MEGQILAEQDISQEKEVPLDVGTRLEFQIISELLSTPDLHTSLSTSISLEKSHQNIQLLIRSFRLVRCIQKPTFEYIGI